MSLAPAGESLRYIASNMHPCRWQNLTCPDLDHTFIPSCDAIFWPLEFSCKRAIIQLVFVNEIYTNNSLFWQSTYDIKWCDNFLPITSMGNSNLPLTFKAWPPAVVNCFGECSTLLGGLRWMVFSEDIFIHAADVSTSVEKSIIWHLVAGTFEIGPLRGLDYTDIWNYLCWVFHHIMEQMLNFLRINE